MLGNGRVYVGFGGYSGDCGTYHGWLVSVDVSGRHKVVFDATPHTGLGAIWATSGPAVTPTATSTPRPGTRTLRVQTHDYGESVVKLDPTLHVLGSFSSSNAVDDEDLGSDGPTLLGNHLLFQVGKQQFGYLIDTTTMTALQSLCTCATAKRSAGTPTTARACSCPAPRPLQAVDVDTEHRTMTLGWTGPRLRTRGRPSSARGSCTRSTGRGTL